MGLQSVAKGGAEKGTGGDDCAFKVCTEDLGDFGGGYFGEDVGV
jgi:hypothetical protein